MKITPMVIDGVFQIEPEVLKDERGGFFRCFCKKEFTNFDINSEIVQCNSSINYKKNVLRGLHFQKNPFAEDKFVTCTMGSVYDVIVDLRKSSKTYLLWLSIILTSENYKTIYIPKGCAHGFLTLEENCRVDYQMTEFYNQSHAYGVPFNDPTLSIKWPFIGEPIISPRDLNWKRIADQEVFYV